jgi:hypothetical protein
MNRAIWKRTEQSIAGIIGGERVPITGRARGDAPDVRHERLSVVVKHRQSIPAWLTTALTQARAAARGDQVPVAIIHRHGGRHGDDFLCMRLAVFVQWFGPVAESEES